MSANPKMIIARALLAAAGLLSVVDVSYSASAAVGDLIGPRVQACTACHGERGQGTEDAYIPRLGGKPAGYLYNQLLAFKTGRRRYTPMNYLLEFLPNDYLKDIADYFATQRQPLPAPVSPIVSESVLALGRELVTNGNADRNIPACQSCHGPSFTGMAPGIPGLLGLRSTYISAQLGAWRYGTRTALSPDCMQVIAGHLTEEDVKAVAAWLSARPAPEATSPAPKGSFALPFACGSEPN
jgi:cytochrome c553